MSYKLIKYFNKKPRLGTLSTSDKNGKVNSAYFGSPRMIDEKINYFKFNRLSVDF